MLAEYGESGSGAHTARSGHERRDAARSMPGQGPGEGWEAGLSPKGDLESLKL